MEENQISWVDWLMMQSESRYFTRIDDDFLNDDFNFYGFQQKIPRFSYCLDVLRGPFYKIEDVDLVSNAVHLYGLLHSRYLLTKDGLSQMHKKYLRGDFELCPRVLCRCECIPFGENEVGNKSFTKLYCPGCGDVYEPEDRLLARIDGAYFGPSWIHSFIGKYPSVIPETKPKEYTPGCFEKIMQTN